MELTRAELAVLLRQDFSAFIERCFYLLNPQTPFLPTWHIELIAAKLDSRPLHLVTTKDDYFRVANTSLDQRLTTKGIAHDFQLGPGPHDYPWNRGAGGVEMLLWHDRVLRG